MHRWRDDVFINLKEERSWEVSKLIMNCLKANLKDKFV